MVLKPGPNRTIRPRKPRIAHFCSSFSLKNCSMGKMQGPVWTVIRSHGSKNHDQTASHGSLLPFESEPKKKKTHIHTHTHTQKRKRKRNTTTESTSCLQNLESYDPNRTLRFDWENLKLLIFAVLLALRTALWKKSRDLCESRSKLMVLRTVIRPLLTVPYFPLNLNLKIKK